MSSWRDLMKSVEDRDRREHDADVAEADRDRDEMERAWEVYSGRLDRNYHATDFFQFFTEVWPSYRVLKNL